jgi:hypothetical protein
MFISNSLPLSSARLIKRIAPLADPTGRLAPGLIGAWLFRLKEAAR